MHFRSDGLRLRQASRVAHELSLEEQRRRELAETANAELRFSLHTLTAQSIGLSPRWDRPDARPQTPAFAAPLGWAS